jgi:uncharacterized protein YfiM (DUF2279 family)
MKKVLTIAIFILASLSAKLFAQTTTQPSSLIHVDKVKHFVVGAAVSGSAQLIAYQITNDRRKAMLIGFGTGMVAGIAKECYDMTGRGTPDIKDALWTGIGAGLASVSIRMTIHNKPFQSTLQAK